LPGAAKSGGPDSFFHRPAQFVLASNSPRRRDLLAAAGYSFEIRPTYVEEVLRPGETPEAGAARIAALKARAAWQTMNPEDRWEIPIVAADTLVVLEGEVFGKPRSEAEARTMLRKLSGRTHKVVTGWCVKVGELERTGSTVSEIAFRRLETRDVDRYLALGESMDKAGAYAIQGGGAALTEWIKGSYTNIVGLPLAEVIRPLEELLAKRPLY
jgi:septum formation protein